MMTTIQEHAERCVRAVMDGDHVVYAEYMHPRLFELVGGIDGVALLLARAAANMLGEGLAFVDVRLGEPEAPRQTGGWLVTLVPQTLTMKQRTLVRSGRVEICSYIVAVSEDAGGTWQFFDAASLQNPHVVEMFPELADLELPALAEPTFTPDP